MGDVVSWLALLVSIFALWLSHKSNEQAKRMADIEAARDEDRKSVRASLEVVNHKHGVTFPESHLKILFFPPESREVIELRSVEVKGERVLGLSVRYLGNRIEVTRDKLIDGVLELSPPVTIIDAPVNLNLSIIYGERAGAAQVVFSGARHDAQRNAVEVLVSVPRRSDTHIDE